MARTNFLAGTTLDIITTLPKAKTEYDKFFIYVYTDKSNIVKFAYPDTTGYNNMGAGDTTSKVTLKCLSSQTAKFNGAIMYEIKLIDDGVILTEDAGVGAVDLTLDAINNYIKNEK